MKRYILLGIVPFVPTNRLLCYVWLLLCWLLGRLLWTVGDIIMVIDTITAMDFLGVTDTITTTI